MDPYSEIIKVAAELARGPNELSSHYEDNPKSTPKKVLKQIERHEERLRDLAFRLKSCAEHIRKTKEYYAKALV